MSIRVMLAALGAVFGIIWATRGIGWATVVVLCALAGWYMGAVIEGGVDLSAFAVLLDPLRRTR